MSKMQRDKGKAYERSWATRLRERFGDAEKKDGGVRRGIQSRGGGKEAADVSCDALPMHFECKHQKRPNVLAALKQAEADARVNSAMTGTPLRIAVAVVKFNGGEELVAMRPEDWLNIIEAEVKWRKLAAAAAKPRRSPKVPS